MAASKRNEPGAGSVLGALATLGVAAALAYLLPPGEEQKQERAPSRSLDPHADGKDAPSGIALDEGRGRSARGPSEIPARGWKDILYRVYKNISDHRVPALAAVTTHLDEVAEFIPRARWPLHATS